MYAITETSYRAIASLTELQPGETAVDVVPRSLLDAIDSALSADRQQEAHLRGRAGNALESLRAYRDLSGPTNAQTIAVVKLLCRVCIALIRMQLRQLDGAD